MDESPVDVQQPPWFKGLPTRVQWVVLELHREAARHHQGRRLGSHYPVCTTCWQPWPCLFHRLAKALAL